jgi:tryptophan synthase beta chain
MSASGYPITYNDLSQISAAAVIEQELDKDTREISIPKEVRELYSNWRPTPLYRAEKFEKALGTPAQIYFKDEGANPSGGLR